MTDLEINPRFCGPADMANGGYVCGLLAAHLRGPVSVRLKAATPLATSLQIVQAPGIVRLERAGTVIAEARNQSVDISPPSAPTFAAVDVHSKTVPTLPQVFPLCFVCGAARQPGDGLRIRAVPMPTGVYAAAWTPDSSLARADNMVASEFLWSSLDCPGAYANPSPRGGLLLLGELTVSIEDEVRVGERCVIVAWPLGVDGRKRFAGTALFKESGELVAKARATWIEPAHR